MIVMKRVEKLWEVRANYDNLSFFNGFRFHRKLVVKIKDEMKNAISEKTYKTDKKAKDQKLNVVPLERGGKFDDSGSVCETWYFQIN